MSSVFLIFSFNYKKINGLLFGKNYINKHQNIFKKNYAVTNQIKNWNNKTNTDEQELFIIFNKKLKT